MKWYHFATLGKEFGLFKIFNFKYASEGGTIILTNHSLWQPSGL